MFSMNKERYDELQNIVANMNKGNTIQAALNVGAKINTNVEKFKKLLLELEVFPSGAEVIYGDNVHEVIGLAYFNKDYVSSDDYILEYPVSPMKVEFDIDAYIEYMYETDYMPLEKIKESYYYEYQEEWYYDFAPQVAPFLHGDIKVLDLYYSDRELLKRYFELHNI